MIHLDLRHRSKIANNPVPPKSSSTVNINVNVSAAITMLDLVIVIFGTDSVDEAASSYCWADVDCDCSDRYEGEY